MPRSTKSEEDYDLMSLPRDDHSVTDKTETMIVAPTTVEAAAVAAVPPMVDVEKFSTLEQKVAELDERFMHGMSAHSISMLDQRRVMQLDHDHKLQKLEQQMLSVEESVHHAVEGLNKHIAVNTVAARKASTIAEENKEEAMSVVSLLKEQTAAVMRDAVAAMDLKWQSEVKAMETKLQAEQTLRITQLQESQLAREAAMQAEVAQLRSALAEARQSLDLSSRMDSLEEDMTIVGHKVGRLAIKAMTSDSMLCRQAEKISTLNVVPAAVMTAVSNTINAVVTAKAPVQSVDEVATTNDIDALRSDMARQKQHLINLEAAAKVHQQKMDARVVACEALVASSAIDALHKKMTHVDDLKTQISKLARKTGEHAILLRNVDNAAESPLAEQNKDDIERLSVLMADYCEINVERINNLDRRLLREETLRLSDVEKSSIMARAIAGRFANLEASITAASAPAVSSATIVMTPAIRKPKAVADIDRPIFGFNTRIVSSRRMNPDDLPTFGFAQHIPSTFRRAVVAPKERPIFSLKGHSIVQQVSRNEVPIYAYSFGMQMKKAIDLIDEPIPSGLPVAIVPQHNAREHFA